MSGSSILNIVGFAPHEWAENIVEWHQLNDWYEDFQACWIKDKKIRRKLMKLALGHPSWKIDLYHQGQPIYIQVRASSQYVDEEEEGEGARISRCHNRMYPLDFCCQGEDTDFHIADYKRDATPLKVEWKVEEVEKYRVCVLEEDNN